MSPMYEYTPDKTYYCAKCANIRQNIYEPCLTCGHKRITETIPSKAKPVTIWLKQSFYPQLYKNIGKCCVVVGILLGVIQVLLLGVYFFLLLTTGWMPSSIWHLLQAAQILFIFLHPGAVGLALLLQGLIWQKSSSSKHIQYLRNATFIWVLLSTICILGCARIAGFLYYMDQMARQSAQPLSISSNLGNGSRQFKSVR